MTTPEPGSSSPSPRGKNLDESLEAEIAEALGDMSVDQIMDVADGAGGGDRPKSTIHREFRTGTIVAVRGADVLVEFGPKSSGVCPLSQFEEAPPIGTHLEFVVDRFDAADGLYVLSREGAVQKANWDALDVGQVIEAMCTGMNKGGLEFEVAHHKAFMPASQVDIRHVKDISEFLGQKLPCQITQIDRKRGRIVLSRRVVLEAERARLRDEVLGALEIGELRDATVTSVQPYGAFADLGGIDGLIHVSDVAHERIKHPSDRLAVGDTVRVKVLKIDRDQDPPRIGLGIKQTLADPSVEAMNELEEGATISGRVTKLMAFGAFVEVAPGVEGLVHISEIAHERIASVDRALKQDEVVTAKVLSIDPQRKRVALSIKALLDRPASSGKKGGRRDRGDEAMGLREDDPAMRKLRARFSSEGLKGGLPEFP